MLELLTDPMHWHFRAEEARRLAEKIDDPAAKAAKYEMADKYERLATLAREWVNRAHVPRFIKSNRAVRFVTACSGRDASLRGEANFLCKIFDTGNPLPPIWHPLPLAFFSVGLGR